MYGLYKGFMRGTGSNGIMCKAHVMDLILFKSESIIDIKATKMSFFANLSSNKTCIGSTDPFDSSPNEQY
ncbi:hypothetical protein HZ326_27049 [Fusarium oxysporum f. sp. albedinis]|nr:hypothetical protein HZ326_27049 [Fusarium oxysporum f. sp. albedinis]